MKNLRAQRVFLCCKRFFFESLSVFFLFFVESPVFFLCFVFPSRLFYFLLQTFSYKLLAAGVSAFGRRGNGVVWGPGSLGSCQVK